uniref:Lipase_3 domain-containing protein n=1 Tax=Strongyloides venezuelensis TaxID=75913 RepID=A0A0K0F3Q0_STRVS
MYFLTIFLLKCNFLSGRIVDFYLTKYYNHRLAGLLYLLALDSYKDNSGVCIPKFVELFKLYSCYRGKRVICDKKRNTCGFSILINKFTKKIIISLSGTVGILQQFREGTSLLKKLKDFHGMGLVNNYFAEIHEYLWKNIKDVFDEPHYKNFKVIVTGHSLGGAMAALIGLRIQFEEIRKSSDIFLYTFGEPRVGTHTFAIHFDKRVPNCWRVVYATDFVAHIPSCKKVRPTRLKLSRKRVNLPCDPHSLNGYYHHGTEVWYPNTKTFRNFYRICLGYPRNEDFNCSDHVNFRIHKYSYHRGHHSQYFLDLYKTYPHIFKANYDKTCKIYNKME